jgi:hypothetical protein
MSESKPANPADWSLLGSELEKLVAENGQTLGVATAINARELLAMMHNAGCHCPEIATGYGCTSIGFHWIEAKVEFEVFDDRVEVYRFQDRHTDIQHHAHRPGEPFSPEIVGALPISPGSRS